MRASTDADKFLATYPPEVQELARRLRTLVTEAVPGAIEMVDTSSKVIGYGFGKGYKNLICTLIPSKGGVKLGVVRGADLPDPTHLLAGSGTTSRESTTRSIAEACVTLFYKVHCAGADQGSTRNRPAAPADDNRLP